MRLIILPQLLSRISLPGLGNLWMNPDKDTDADSLVIDLATPLRQTGIRQGHKGGVLFLWQPSGPAVPSPWQWSPLWVFSDRNPRAPVRE